MLRKETSRRSAAGIPIEGRKRTSVKRRARVTSLVIYHLPTHEDALFAVEDGVQLGRLPDCLDEERSAPPRLCLVPEQDRAHGHQLDSVERGDSLDYHQQGRAKFGTARQADIWTLAYDTPTRLSISRYVCADPLGHLSQRRAMAVLLKPPFLELFAGIQVMMGCELAPCHDRSCTRLQMSSGSVSSTHSLLQSVGAVGK